MLEDDVKSFDRAAGFCGLIPHLWKKIINSSDLKGIVQAYIICMYGCMYIYMYIYVNAIQYIYNEE